MFQHTAARRRLGAYPICSAIFKTVSTHSRPKAAGCLYRTEYQGTKGFNTQPPEGGWYFNIDFSFKRQWFQHTAARRRLAAETRQEIPKTPSFNTQPPEGGWAGGVGIAADQAGFNTQPPEGGWPRPKAEVFHFSQFQHTAARRRLVTLIGCFLLVDKVSTHSRPKAAGTVSVINPYKISVSTHSRPKAAGND